MGQALYRTYRPLKLTEVVGQEHVTTALAHALARGTVSHAYLFTGPRGVGKTSIARILAHEINGLPYSDESVHLDIIEIDAASNRRIDEIRDLRDKVHIAPTSAKYKVYIIDEVHMLTREAFNALLKTLEEPPAHAVFILATTESHKLPETIISRTQRYTFKPVALEKVVAHLRDIATEEKITISDEALELIAAHGEGSFRDSISLLDQVRNIGKAVELADVEAMLGIAPESVITAIIDALAGHDPSAIAQTFQQAKEHGYEAARLAKQLAERLRLQVIDGNLSVAHNVALGLLAKLVAVPASPDPATYLEIILLDTALTGQAPTPVATPKPPAKPTAAVKPPATHTPTPQTPSSSGGSSNPSPPAKSETKKAEKPEPKIEPESQPKPKAHGTVLDKVAWTQILEQIRKNYSTLYSILKSAEVSLEPGLIRLSFEKDFYRKRANDAKNKQIIAETVQAVAGQAPQIECSTLEKPTSSSNKPTEAAAVAPTPSVAEPVISTPAATANNSIENISNIFGGAELLES
ncbi:MAG TPA: DNA polymerase III subunit gamma/tau [Candidatus Saccharimonadales bacterium]|nr:DNA polymerase III subunit gamma/tau [Candidatus Saccharimonadales bacterium]